jgi:hypothetical protein
MPHSHSLPNTVPFKNYLSQVQWGWQKFRDKTSTLVSDFPQHSLEFWPSEEQTGTRAGVVVPLSKAGLEEWEYGKSV